MIALWKDFVQKTFQRTGFRTTFNGVTRTVFRDATRLVILDEYHGDLEVLAFQSRAGQGHHQGSQELEVVLKPSRPGVRPVVDHVKLGKFKPGGKHKYVLTGSL
jgi:hypothetical protein